MVCLNPNKQAHPRQSILTKRVARKAVKTRDRDLKLSSNRRRSLRASTKISSATSTGSSSSSGTTKICWSDRNWKLFLTTANKVCIWDNSFCATVFTSGSEGILAAKRSKDGSILAVADAQIVILHKVDQGQHQSYRLKGAEGNCRLLQYTHDSKSLFFTDTIHNSVQTYSLGEDRVNEAAKAHPSIITSFCVSPNSNFLLSCSADPPVIQLHNRQLNNTVDIKPRASSKPVVCCAFHPNRRSIFVLAFADGVLAAYDSTRLLRGDKARSMARKGNVGSGGGEHIHYFSHLHDSSITGGPGITGVEFIPGYRARAVSVGEDGRLFIVDFEKKDVLGSWHVGAPATCVSVRPAVGKDAGKSSGDAGWMVAVGTIHGRCFVFDGGGTKICEQTVDAEAGKVLDVEWVSGEIPLPPSIGISESIPSAKSTIKSPSSHYPESVSSAITDVHAVKSDNAALSSLAENSEAESNSSLVRLPTNPPLLPELPRLPAWQELVEGSTASYLSMFSPVKKIKPTKAMSEPDNRPANIKTNMVTDLGEGLTKQADQRSVISAPQIWNEKPIGNEHGPSRALTDASSAVMATFDGSGGREACGMTDLMAESDLAERAPSLQSPRFQDSTSSRSVSTTTATVTDPAKLLSDIKNIRGDTDGPQGLALFAPYMPVKPNSRRALLKGFAKKAVTVEGEGAVRDSNEQPRSLNRSGQESTDTPNESLTADKSSIAKEQKTSVEEGRGSGKTPLEHSQVGVEVSDESSDEADIWLIQGLQGDQPSPMSTRTGSGKLGEHLKRKALLGDESEIEKSPVITTVIGAAESISIGSKTSAGVGSVRSPLGSNKSRRIVSGWDGSRDQGETISQKKSSAISGHVSTAAQDHGTDRPRLKSEKPHLSPAAGVDWEEAMTQVRKDIRAMHDDMRMRLEEQRTLLEAIARENSVVNEKLRRELLEMAGSRRK